MTTWYFDGVSGDDSNSGTTPSAPKRNASSVVFSAGDVVRLRAGVEWVAPSGTQAINLPANGIRVEPYDAADRPPKINCGNVSRGINVGTNIAGWTIEGIWIDNVASGTSRRGIVNATTGSSETVTVNGVIRNVLVTNVITDGVNDCNGMSLVGDGLRILDSTVEDVATDGIWLRARNAEIGGCAIRRVAKDDDVRGAFGDCVQFGGTGSSDFTGAWVHDCELDHTSSTNVKNALIINGASATTAVTVEHNRVLASRIANQVAIYVDVPGAVVRRNRVVGGDYAIYMGNAAGGLVEANFARDANFGVRLASSAVGTRVRQNALVLCGVGFYGSASDATTQIVNNVLYRCGIGLQRHGTMTENANCYFGNTTDVSGLGGTIIGGAQSFIGDPLFVDPLCPELGVRGESPLFRAGIWVSDGLCDMRGVPFCRPGDVGPFARPQAVRAA